MPQHITVAHSPDADDAFMFYALAKGKIDTGDFCFKHTLKDIETLNQAARTGEFDITAISFHAYPYLAADYVLLSSGSSMGENYGPVVVTREPTGLSPECLNGKTVASPGPWTTARLALSLWNPKAKPMDMGFNEVLTALDEGRVDAALIIHEGQVLYENAGYHKVVDMGEWWHKRHEGLPLPLGANAIRKCFDPETRIYLADCLKRSIQYALDHRSDALDYAMEFGRGIPRDSADKFVGMYVNERTLDWGPEGERAIRLLLEEGARAGLIPAVELEIVSA